MYSVCSEYIIELINEGIMIYISEVPLVLGFWHMTLWIITAPILEIFFCGCFVEEVSRGSERTKYKED